MNKHTAAAVREFNKSADDVNNILRAMEDDVENGNVSALKCAIAKLNQAVAWAHIHAVHAAEMRNTFSGPEWDELPDTEPEIPAAKGL